MKQTTLDGCTLYTTTISDYRSRKLRAAATKFFSFYVKWRSAALFPAMGAALISSTMYA